MLDMLVTPLSLRRDYYSVSSFSGSLKFMKDTCESGSQLASTVTVPWLVNLIAFERRLTKMLVSLD